MVVFITIAYSKEVYQIEHKISSDIDIFTRYIRCHISASGAAFFASGANS
jgi:hypothetical protein